MRALHTAIRLIRRSFLSCDIRELNFIAVDTETTGLEPTLAGITEVGWVGVMEGRLLTPTSLLVQPSFVHQVDDHPLCIANEERRRNTGDRRVKEALDAIVALGEKIRCTTGVRPSLAFHNATYDIAMLTTDEGHAGCNMNRLLQENHGPFARNIIDTRVIAYPMVMSGQLKSTSLKSLCELVGVRPGNHTAAEDARATAECIIKLLTEGWV